ncbi:hypothetical protein [Roseivirga thermotolerans]|uniref:hypothetical protein n=1 Tax=Roseivirga thermotolerans TaxID=1758176 RepID=UPI00273FDE93|nr:hypothetical protein [Roseivirga thermotolerans]
MKKTFKKLGVMMVALAVVLTSCEDLEVENLNDLDSRAVYADATSLPSVIDGAFLTWWQGIQLSSPNMPVSVAAQTLSSSWGNWGMQDLGTIPRAPIQNTVTYNNRAFMTTPWYNLNNALAQANEVLRVLETEFNGSIQDNQGNDLTAQTVANAKMLQGLTLGWLGLIFDQAFIADESLTAEELAALEMSPYTDVIEAAVTKLTEAATMFAANSGTTHTAINGLNYDNTGAAQFCRAYAAKLLAYKARSGAETAANDWNRILTLANGGTTADISPAGDGQFWWTRILIQGQFPLWSRVSQRLINMMEGGIGGPSTNDPNHPTAPYPWPDGTSTLPEITNPRDARITKYYQYNTGVQFQSARGYYFFSSYNFRKYPDYLAAFLGPMPHLTLNEQNLIKAEALIRTGGDKLQAAAYINNTRVDNGELPALTGLESNADMLKALYYERLVEFTWDGALNGWFFRRMTTVDQYQLQPGTPQQMPVPAQELEILGLDVYTFGGA